MIMIPQSLLYSIQEKSNSPTPHISLNNTVEELLDVQEVYKTSLTFSVQTKNGSMSMNDRSSEYHGKSNNDDFDWTKINTPPPSSRFTEFKTPMMNQLVSQKIFRTPNLARYLNIGMNQPVIPRTPLQRREVTVPNTCLSQRSTFSTFDNFVLPTPLICSSLTSLDAGSKFDNIGPDILELIDDDSTDVSCINRHIGMVNDNVELDDNTVIEYVLNITNDVQSKTCQPTCNNAQEKDSIQVKRRKGRHAKRMTEEEKKLYKEMQKQKAKERQKERKTKFLKEEVGITRRSKRSTRKRISYKV